MSGYFRLSLPSSKPARSYLYVALRRDALALDRQAGRLEYLCGISGGIPAAQLHHVPSLREQPAARWDEELGSGGIGAVGKDVDLGEGWGVGLGCRVGV